MRFDHGKVELGMTCLQLNPFGVRGWLFVMLLALAGCGQTPDDVPKHAPYVGAPDLAPAVAAFDGADYASAAGKVAHGQRVATLFGCNGCHGPDYAGLDFGAMIPIVDGLWASNISLTMPSMDDATLERLLREGVHPSRELYVMPSKQTQFLGDRDMAALLAFLRTIPPAGKATPLPPEDFESAVTARLPDDYWLTQQEKEKRPYHNAAEEVAYFAAHQPAQLGPQFARGRMIAASLCSSCHGAALDGLGEPAGDIQGALSYDDVAFNRLLTDSVDRTGKQVSVEWGFGHEVQRLTEAERADVIAYVRELARTRVQ